MGTNNMARIMVQSNKHIANIYRLLKDIKLKVSADYIYLNNKRIVIITNKVAIFFNLNTVEKYIKELNDVDVNNIMSPKCPQLNSYLKILGILYFVDNTNLPITLDIIETVVKSTHIFNNIVLTSHPWFIKVFPKSNGGMNQYLEFINQYNHKESY